MPCLCISVRTGFWTEAAICWSFYDRDSWYTHFRSYYPIHLLFQGLWAIFVIKFIQLKKYSKFLYYLIFYWIGVNVVDYFFSVLNKATVLGDYFGQNYTPLRLLLHWFNLEYIGYLGVTLFFLLISIIYVSIKDFKTARWYALAFSIGLISMIIAILALYDISWLPHYPFNNFYFIGSLLEIILLGFILAQRANQHRKEQVQTQQQLIVQLQENLRQQNKLLQIRDEIARDIFHDEVGATLTSIATSAKVIQKKVGTKNLEANAILGQIKNRFRRSHSHHSRYRLGIES